MRISKQRERNEEKSHNAANLIESEEKDLNMNTDSLERSLAKRQLRARGGSRDSDKSEASTDSLSMSKGKRKCLQSTFKQSGSYPKAKKRRMSSDNNQDVISNGHFLSPKTDDPSDSSKAEVLPDAGIFNRLPAVPDKVGPSKSMAFSARPVRSSRLRFQKEGDHFEKHSEAEEQLLSGVESLQLKGVARPNSMFVDLRNDAIRGSLDAADQVKLAHSFDNAVGKASRRRIQRRNLSKCDNSSLDYIDVRNNCSRLDNNNLKGTDSTLPTLQLSHESSCVHSELAARENCNPKRPRANGKTAGDVFAHGIESRFGHPTQPDSLYPLHHIPKNSPAKDVYEFEEDENEVSPTSLRGSSKSPSVWSNSRIPSDSSTEMLPSEYVTTNTFVDSCFVGSTAPVTPEKSPQCRVKLTLRMKRSPVLDEVIESGSHISDRLGSFPYHHEPEYEVLTMEGISTADYVTPDEDSSSSRHQTPRSRHHRKHRKKHRKRSDYSEGESTDVDGAQPRMKRVKLIIGNELSTFNIPSTDLIRD